jgi:hypothetical protein
MALREVELLLSASSTCTIMVANDITACGSKIVDLEAPVGILGLIIRLGAASDDHQPCCQRGGDS